MERIFIVDDDAGICRTVENLMLLSGYDVRYAHDRTGLFRAAAEWEPQLIILDVRLGRENGMDIARSFRAMYDTPILMLTGETRIDDRISGLESGADDYLCKPFDNGELLARVRALLRRHSRTRDPGETTSAPIALDRGRRILSTPDGAHETLTELQTNLMAVLLERSGHVISREDIYALVFRRPWTPSDRSLEVHMSNLRKLLERMEPNRVEIQSIRHVGYRLIINTTESGKNPA